MSNGLRDSILDLLNERGPVEMVEMAESLSAHPITVDRQCRKLLASGYIRQVSTGVYMITTKGQGYLENHTDYSGPR